MKKTVIFDQGIGLEAMFIKVFLAFDLDAQLLDQAFIGAIEKKAAVLDGG